MKLQSDVDVVALNAVARGPNLTPLHNKQRTRKVEEVVDGLRLDADAVLRVRGVFEQEMEAGRLDQPSSLQMENTFIPELLDGTENGSFMALDLGGTNFRVMNLVLKDGRLVDENIAFYHVDDHLRIGCGYRLFDFLAECIADFVHKQGLGSGRLPLGFTFSFPMTQSSLDDGKLVTWTKSFNCPNVVGMNAVQLLRDALAKRGDVNVDVMAVLNDTAGTLVKGSYLDRDCAIGLILGTGSNACFLEHAHLAKNNSHLTHGEKDVIVDIEWGAFGDNGSLDFIRTEFDDSVDEVSVIPGSFTFEKYIGGKYLGELVRRALVRLVGDGLLFSGTSSAELNTTWAFTTSMVSHIEQDNLDGLHRNTREILDSFNLNFDADDVLIVQWVCQLASNRAALLVSTCLAVLLDRMERPTATIAVDGSVYQKHPRFKALLEKYTSMLAPKRKRKFLLAEDGSGKGAGLVAAIAEKLRLRNNNSSL
ncbi:hexokinase-2 [Frankliniella occidentalis]|uniref:Phosphotransferase n=1 Tax=Frankliniella occidentalis TaxID=133901 RepID=A0A9C6WN95_FRAOC|nr:hexokinase-2 [Frankliniella occidentalis]